MVCKKFWLQKSCFGNEVQNFILAKNMVKEWVSKRTNNKKEDNDNN